MFRKKATYKISQLERKTPTLYKRFDGKIYLQYNMICGRRALLPDEDQTRVSVFVSKERRRQRRRRRQQQQEVTSARDSSTEGFSWKRASGIFFSITYTIITRRQKSLLVKTGNCRRRWKWVTWNEKKLIERYTGCYCEGGRHTTACLPFIRLIHFNKRHTHPDSKDLPYLSSSFDKDVGIKGTSCLFTDFAIQFWPRKRKSVHFLFQRGFTETMVKQDCKLIIMSFQD